MLRIVREMPPLDPDLEAVVEAHWQAAQGLHRLFNGRVFCADRVAPGLIEGHWTEYRRLVAQMREPSLRPAVGVRSLAACGMLCSPDGIAVGRRDRSSVYQAGMWQLPPAGSIDPSAAMPGGADWRTALLAELREELGMGPEHVERLEPLCLLQHPSGVLDLCVRIDTGLRAPEILARHAALGDGEYEELLIEAAEALPSAVLARGGTLVPAARILLGHAPASTLPEDAARR